MKRIIPGLHTFGGLLVGRVYLVEDADGLTLIDTSIAPAAKRILNQLAAIGRSPHDVKRILITHAHPDHVGGLPELKAATGAQVVASSQECAVIEGQIPVPRVAKEKLSGVSRLLRPPETRLKPTSVEREVRDGEVLSDVMGGLQVVFTPGHAPGHIAFWHPEKRILVCGDVIFRAPTPKLRLPFAFLTVDMAENIRSVQRIAELNPSIVCFGHGEPLTENAAQTLHEFAQRVSASTS